MDAPPVRDATTDGDHDGVVNEVPVSVVDYMEFYLLNYFKPGRGPTTRTIAQRLVHVQRDRLHQMPRFRSRDPQ